MAISIERDKVAFEYNGQVAWVNPENDDVFFNGAAHHIDELYGMRWYSLHNAAVQALVEYDEVLMYG